MLAYVALYPRCTGAARAEIRQGNQRGKSAFDSEGRRFESFRARQLSPYKITVSAVCSTQEKPGRGTRSPRRLSRDSAAARPTKHFFLNERTSVDQCLYRCWAGPHGELDGRVWSRNSCCVERRHFPGACCRRIVALNRNRADAPRALVLGLRFVVRSVTIPIGGCRMLCHVSNVAEVPLCRTVIWTPQRPEPASRSCGEPGPWLILGVHPRTLLS